MGVSPTARFGGGARFLLAAGARFEHVLDGVSEMSCVRVCGRMETWRAGFGESSIISEANQARL